MAGALYLSCCADVGTSSSKSRLKGWTNLAISGEGKREALAIGMAIQGAPLTTLFSSDLDRAITAAQLIASEAETSDIQPSSAWRGTDESEKFEAFESRVFAALQLAMARVQAEDTCLICAHDAVIQLVLAWIESGQDKLSVDPKTFSKTKITGNLITLALNGKTWMVAQTQGVGSSAKRPIPPCADSEIKRIALGQYLQQLIQAGLAAQGNAVQWWEKCLENHRNEFSDDSKPGEGMSSLHIPFAQPRQDMLTAQVCSAVAKQDPYMLASDAAGRGDVEEKKEKVLHRFWQRAGFEKAIRKASSLTTDTNLAWIRVAWDRTSKKPFSGLILDVIEPWNLVIYPPRQTGIVGSRLAGHRFYSSFKSVTILQKSGTYFDDRSVMGGDTPDNVISARAIQDAGVNPSVTTTDPGDLSVECWQVIFSWSEKIDDPERLYIATVAVNSAVVLSCDYYDYSRPWYFDASYIIESSEAYYPGVSVARHLSGLQDAYDKVSALIYNGAQITAFPPIFAQTVDQKDYRYSYGDVIPADTPAQNWSPTINFKGEMLLQILAALERNGDQVARVSANTMGAQQARPTTATEGSIIAQGVSVGLEEYINNFSASLPEAAEFTMELLSEHFADWQQDAQMLQVKQSDIVSPCNWDVNGNTPGSTPGAKLAALDKVSGFAKEFGPETGFDVYEMGSAILKNSPLSGTDNIQIPREQMEAKKQQAQAAQTAQQAQTQQVQGGQAPVQGGQALVQSGPQMPPSGSASRPSSATPNNLTPQDLSVLLMLAHEIEQHQSPPQPMLGAASA